LENVAVSVFRLKNVAIQGNNLQLYRAITGVRAVSSLMGRCWLLNGHNVFSEKKDARKNFRRKLGKRNFRGGSRKWKIG
jgi:hypothetical protein